MKFRLFGAIDFAAIAAAIALAVSAGSTASAQGVLFTQQMSIGSRGAEVSALQSFLATQTSHYPEGLVTGYYGPLTAAAVMRFQCAEEIVCSGSAATTGYGRVGPMTLMQLNLRASGSTGADVSAPHIVVASVATSTNAATVNFSTSEMARSKVYYASLPITLTEAGIGFAPVIGGTGVMTDANFRVAHAIALASLSPNTTYFYVVEATDASGNTSVTWPSTFRTGQ